MPGRIKSQAQFRLMQMSAHSNPHKQNRARISSETAKKILADNPVKDVSALPHRVKPK